jgi:hypothetical protein
VFENLIGSNVDEKDEREASRAGRQLPFKWKLGPQFLECPWVSMI